MRSITTADQLKTYMASKPTNVEVNCQLSLQTSGGENCMNCMQFQYSINFSNPSLTGWYCIGVSDIAGAMDRWSLKSIYGAVGWIE